MTNDVWASSEAGGPAGGGDTFGGDVGEGLHGNQAFSIDMVFRNGIAIAKEQPGFFAAAAAAIGVLTLGPQVLSIIVSWGFLAAEATGSNPVAGPAGQLLPSFIQLGIGLLAMPFQQLVQAGAAVGVKRIVATGETELADLWRNILPAVRGFLYSVVIGLILSPVALVLYLLFIGVMVGLFALELPGALIVLLAFVIGLAMAAPVVWLYLSLMLGWYAAVVDEAWPMEALSRGWAAARDAHGTLFVTMFVYFLASVVAGLSIYCLLGFVLYPALQVVTLGGFATGWLLHARPEDVTRKWGFFERNPTGYF